MYFPSLGLYIYPYVSVLLKNKSFSYVFSILICSCVRIYVCGGYFSVLGGRVTFIRVKKNIFYRKLSVLLENRKPGIT